MSCLRKTVCEVEAQGIRYVLRRNPIRTEEIAMTRLSKLDTVKKIAAGRTQYLDLVNLPLTHTEFQ